AAFNFGPGNAECMAAHGSPMFDSFAVGFDVELAHNMLGITLDFEVSFTPHAKATLAMGQSLLDELYQAAQCRWDLGVGSLVFLQVIMARARLWVLLEGHTAAVMREAARASLAPYRWRAVGQIMTSMPNGPVPDISLHEGFKEGAVAAQSSPAPRKSLSRRYRQEVAMPALHAYDQPSADTAASRPLPYLERPFGSLMLALQHNLQHDVFDDHGGSLYYRPWAVCRVIGRWPLPVLGGEAAPLVLPRCGACPSADVDVSHALLACGQTLASGRQLWAFDGGPPATRQAAFLAFFGP
ncbi:unnamed protein product, partial [Prorocentrum cordatum]